MPDENIVSNRSLVPKVDIKASIEWAFPSAIEIT